MPSYDFRCNACQQALTLVYKSYKAYDEAVPVCPHCGSADLTRVITSVRVAKSGRSYAGMSSGEMLSVLEKGDAGEVNELHRQVYDSGDKAAGT
jgi:putative FmdB family regulatory protein